jgi:hypothetical protein
MQDNAAGVIQNIISINCTTKAGHKAGGSFLSTSLSILRLLCNRGADRRRAPIRQTKFE